jgi:hypothetical protein
MLCYAQFLKDERKSDPNFNIIQVADSLGQMATPWYLVQPEDVLSTDQPVSAPDEQTAEKMLVVRPFSFLNDTIHSLSPKAGDCSMAYHSMHCIAAVL